MSLGRSSAPPAYDAADENAFRDAVDAADARNQKTDEDVLVTPARRLLLVDHATGALHALKLVGGVLVVEAV